MGLSGVKRLESSGDAIEKTALQIRTVDLSSRIDRILQSMCCRDKRRVKAERVMVKRMSMLLLTGGIFMQVLAWAAPPYQEGDSGIKTATAVEEVQVFGKRIKSRSERDYKVKNGKRFVTEPYGDIESILAIAAETKRLGKVKRVTTRGITMPQSYAGGVLDRYEHRFPRECGGEKFSLYQGKDFIALGYHYGERVILDVVTGGGPFVSAQLWGPYDQILGDRRNISMKMVMGDGEKDGMGSIKASYAIGMMPMMKRDNYERFGRAYVVAIKGAMECLFDTGGSGESLLRQAKSEW